jgi:hypothetical protein
MDRAHGTRETCQEGIFIVTRGFVKSNAELREAAEQ